MPQKRDDRETSFFISAISYKDRNSQVAWSSLVLLQSLLLACTTTCTVSYYSIVTAYEIDVMRQQERIAQKMNYMLEVLEDIHMYIASTMDFQFT